MQYPATILKPATEASVRINYDYPDDRLTDLQDILFEVSNEIHDANLPREMSFVSNAGGDLTDAMLFHTERTLRDLADRVAEVRTALAEVV